MGHEGRVLGTGRKDREALRRGQAGQVGVWSLCRQGQAKAKRRRIEKKGEVMIQGVRIMQKDGELPDQGMVGM